MPSGSSRSALHVRHARLGGDREPGRHPVGAEHSRHLGDVRALAPEQLAHLPGAFAEVIDPTVIEACDPTGDRCLGGCPGCFSRAQRVWTAPVEESTDRRAARTGDEIDWHAIARSPEFARLEATRRRVTFTALGVFSVAVAAFLILCGYARPFMTRSVDDGLTVAYVWLLALTVLAWVLVWMYLRFAERRLEPASAELAQQLRVPGTRRRGAMTLFVAASTPARGLTIAVFLVVLAITLGVTFVAARRIRSASDYWSAGHGISGAQNGMAVAGEFLSAAAFLGVAGLMFLSGFDGYLTGIAALLSFVPLLLLLAERMRNAGRYTMADVLALRMPAGRTRVTSAVSTMCIAVLYVVAQSVAAGSLLEALVGIPYWAAVVITGAAILTYVILGGMVATTWVQIIKASLLLVGVGTMAIWVLAKFGFSPIRLLDRAAARSQGQGLRRPRAALPQPPRRDLDRPGVRPRDLRAAAHHDALFDRARRPPGAALGRLGGRPDRRLLPVRRGHRSRRASDPRRRRNQARGQDRQFDRAVPRPAPRRRTRLARRRHLLRGDHRGGLHDDPCRRLRRRSGRLGRRRTRRVWIGDPRAARRARTRRSVPGASRSR